MSDELELTDEDQRLVLGFLRLTRVMDEVRAEMQADGLSLPIEDYLATIRDLPRAERLRLIRERRDRESPILWERVRAKVRAITREQAEKKG